MNDIVANMCLQKFEKSDKVNEYEHIELFLFSRKFPLSYQGDKTMCRKPVTAQNSEEVC